MLTRALLHRNKAAGAQLGICGQVPVNGGVGASGIAGDATSACRTRSTHASAFSGTADPAPAAAGREAASTRPAPAGIPGAPRIPRRRQPEYATSAMMVCAAIPRHARPNPESSPASDPDAGSAVAFPCRSPVPVLAVRPAHDQRSPALIFSSTAEPGQSSRSPRLLNATGAVPRCACRSGASGSTYSKPVTSSPRAAHSCK